MNLVGRQLLLVVVAVLPTLLVGIYNEYKLREARAAEVREQVEALAERTRAELRQIIEGVQRVAVTLSYVPIVTEALVSRTPGSIAECERLLDDLDSSYPGGLGVGVAAGDGALVCTASPVPPGTAVRGDHLRRAMESGGFVIGGYGTGPSGRGFLSFAQGLRALDGTPVGGLVLGVDLDWLARHLATRFGAQQAVVAVSDRDLVYLVRVPDDETQIVGKPGPATWEQVAALLDKGALDLRGVDGVNRVAAFLPLIVSSDAGERPDLLIGFGLSRDAAFAPIDAATTRSAILLGTSFSIALLAAWLGSRRLVRRPVARLLEAITSWRDGNYAARVGHHDPAEFGRVQAAFDDMAAHIATRTRELAESEKRLRMLSDLVPAFIWFGDVEGEIRYVNQRWYTYTGQADDGGAPGWGEVVHPEDTQKVFARWATCIAQEIPFEHEVRLRASHGAYRWFLMRAVPVRESGRLTAWFGSSTDIDDLKRAEEHRKLLVHELNHRVKNTLATVQSIAAQSLRGTDPDVARRRFEERLLALSRAQDLLTRENWHSASLVEIVGEAVRPFRGERADRFVIAGPDASLPPRLAVPLSMALHELLTNATKYGALSVEHGRVSIFWTVACAEDAARVELRWQETDGPAVSAPSTRGFGSRLLERGLARELEGTVDLRFDPLGVACIITFQISVADVRSVVSSEAAAESRTGEDDSENRSASGEVNWRR